MIRFIVHGAAGRMGQAVIAALTEHPELYTVAAAIDPYYAQSTQSVEYPTFVSVSECKEEADCIIDFSNHLCTVPLLAYARAKKIPVMLATTGHTDEEKAAIDAAALEIPVFRAANMSLGIATLCSLVKKAVAMFPDADIEIVEKHHNKKLDVPSGTALALAEAVHTVRHDARFLVGRHENGLRTKEEIGIHSLRLGGVVGEHEVIITTGNETITLKHEAHTRAVFADGAVAAGVFLYNKAPGLYTMEDLIAE